MKANELTKKEFTLSQIYERISNGNEVGGFKIFIHHFEYVSDQTKLKLIDDGFKVYVADWDGINKNVLIIEW